MTVFPNGLFTFHYVSIKSYLTAVKQDKDAWFTFHYVSIKSFSLICSDVSKILFTFHYVSIKSLGHGDKSLIILNLHSTMYLLNQI